jgi:hypothetical protein
MMRRSHSALLHARSLALAGLMVVGPSTLIAGPAAAGRGSPGPERASATDARGARVVDRAVRLHGASAETRAGNRPARHIVANALPKATGAEPAYQSKRGSAAFGTGTGSGGSKAPGSFPTTPLAPTEATVTTTNPADEAVSGDGQAQATAEPPDATIAAGPDHVVQATNEGVRITNRALGSSTAPVTLSAFFGIDAIPNYDAVTFDPHVLFDTAHNRWLATEASFDCIADPQSGINIGTGYIDIAISDTADPTLGWSILSVPYPDTAPDYPGIGTSTDKIVASANVFLLKDTGTGLGCDIDESSGLLGTELDVISWAQMIGSGSVDIDFLTSYIAPFDFANDFFTFRPAVQTPALSAPVFGIGIRLSTAGAVWFKITGLPSAGTTAVSIANVAGVDPFDNSVPDPAQPSGAIAAAVDGRPTDAIWQNNRLAYVSTIGCDPAGGGAEERDCVRITELAVSASTVTPTVTQDLLVAETGRDLYMGGIGFSQNSDLHVVWTGSSSTAGDFPSTYTAYQLKGGTANTLQGKQEIADGTANYGGTGFGDRWGDYVTVAQDPQVPDAVWQADEFSEGTWLTHVSQLRTFAGASYTPITPARVMDSRNNTGVTGVYVANVPKTFQVAGVGVIPSDAIGVTGNVTVVGQTAAGYVSVTPTASANPTSSTINFPKGDVRANNFTLPLGSGGKLSAVYKAAAGKTTNALVDITGYFTAGNTEATYVPLDPPARVLDSRGATGGFAGVPFSSGVPRDLQVAGVAGVPGNATAITGNITIVGQTKAGYVSVTPETPVGVPPSSTINFPVGDIRANGLTADLNGSGKLSITLTAPGGTAHVLLDVTGYYLDDSTGKLFYPLSPGRILESRDATTHLTGLHGVFTSNVARTLPTAGHWGVPADADAITGNLTVVNQTQAGYVAVTPVATNTPPTSTINFPLGDVRANGITVPLSGGSMGLVYKAGTGKTTHLLLDVTGYFK